MAAKAKVSKLRVIRELVSMYMSKHISRSAAELAYFLTLSIFPMLICLNAMLGSAFPTHESLLEITEGLIPDGTIIIISDYIKYITTNSSSSMVTAGLILMATTAAALFRSIHNIMAELQGSPRFRGPVAMLFSFVFSLIFLAVMYFGVVVIFAGSWFISFVDLHTGINISDAWTWLRFILLFCMLLVMIYGVYKLTAPRGAQSQLMLGAVVASVALVASSMIFSLFIGMSTRYPLVYGSLASFIILMVWLYICGNILIMGNGLNIVLRRERERVSALAAAKEGIDGGG